MQISDLFCYAVLTVTVTASCVAAGTLESKKHEVDDRKSEKRVRRQEATMLIDNFPMETVYQKPKVINYRRLSRISRQRYGPPGYKYGPPRPKYGSLKPGKKYRGKPSSSKYRPSTLRRTPKPKSRYGPPKRAIKPTYGRPRKPPQYAYYPPEPVGFGEPPTNYGGEYQTKLKHNNEPPVDSYGAPIKPNLNDLYSAVHNYDGPSYNDDFSKFGQYQSWSAHRDQNTDSSYASSKRVPMFAKPQDIFVTPVPNDNEESLTSYSDIYDHRQMKEQKTSKSKKRNPHVTETTKVPSSWKVKHKPEDEDEIIVGGQYAEPPARYVAKFQPSAPMYTDDDFSPGQNYDSEGSASATVSAYVNYKNSNMAFSPQNLNDAFSIEK